ncbi:MAG: tetraacyldisaccharide 4'-kinase [Acidobacteriota bacterium]
MRYTFNPFILAFLYIPSRLYAFLVFLRNLLYERHIFPVHKVERLVISIGNITVGGTGKTPFAAYLCQHFSGMGKRVVIVSRGYRGTKNREVLIVADGKGKILAQPAECGDEPFLLAQLLPDVAVIVSRKRSKAIKEAVSQFDPDLIILDDGFQHRAVSRDADILLIDAMDPFGNYRILPAGILREPIKNIRRASIIVITRVERDEEHITLERIIRKHNPGAAIFTSGHRITEFVRNGLISKDAVLSPSDLAHKKVYAFCGIGNPDVFIHDLENLGAHVAGKRIFRDHHSYSLKDARDIEEDARLCGAEILVTTQKDLVRIPRIENFSLPLYHARISVNVYRMEEFFSTLERFLSRPQH